MPPSLFLCARTRAFFFISICVVVISVVLLWTTAQQASAPRRKAGRSDLSSSLVDPDKGGTTPDAGAIVVNSTADVVNSTDGLCTLREAITAANTNLASGAATGECAAGSNSGSDTISFSITGTIILTSVLPTIASDMTVSGPSADSLILMRSAAGGIPSFRILSVNNGATAIVSGLTISGGNLPSANNGGGVVNNGTLTMNSCDIVGNSLGTNSASFGGGIFNTGQSLTLNNCNIGSTASGQGNTATDGGGIYMQSGTLTMTGGSVSGNSGNGLSFVMGGSGTLNGVSVSNNNYAGRSGGGIAVATLSSTTILNCLISNNVAQTGGGISNNSTTNVFNTTISGNSATASGGGVFNQAGFFAGSNLALMSTTITNNRSDIDNAGAEPGGGIAQTGGSIGLSNTIVAGNFRGASPATTADDINGTVTASSAFNLIGTGGSGGLTNGTNNNQVGVIDPRLGPLSDNLGATKTHALLVGSPAIDAGNSSLTTDQRGQPRPIDDPNVANAASGNASDIGAYEAHTIEVNSTSDTTDGACTLLATGNGCTLREAITAANSAAGGEMIVFAPALTSGGPATIDLSSALPDLTSDMVIAGPGANLLTIRRSLAISTPDFRIFTIKAGMSVVLSAVTLSNGRDSDGINEASPGGGGAIYNNGSLNNSGSLTIMQCAIAGNSSSTATSGGQGGAIINYLARLNISDTTISGNFGGTAGGIYNVQGPLTITNSTISNNSSYNSAAALYTVVSPVTITNTTITGNHAGVGMPSLIGGIQVSFGSTFILRNSIVAGNVVDTPSTIADDIQGALDTSSAFNLIGTCSNCGLSNGLNGNQVGVSSAGLGPLANNGGPTMTHALLSGSPALDAGSSKIAANAGLASDQRGAGFNRIVDGPDSDSTATVDIGAFEAQVSIEDVPDKTINEDAQIQFTFNVGGSISGVTATSSDTTLVPNNAANLALTGSGATRTLTITPAANQFGSSTISITVNGGNNQSMTDTFVLTVNPVNDAPSFTRGPNQTVNNNAGLQTIPNWATNISAGPANESSQTLNFSVIGNTIPTLFSVAPAVSSNGTLSFQPASNQGGTATITVQLQDNGGIANGGVDKSAAAFDITVMPVGGFVIITWDSNPTENSGFTTVNIGRSTGLSQPITVDYATSGDNGVPCSTRTGVATPKCDFTAALGTLSFAAGESSKTVTILISQDSFVEGPEIFTVTISNPTGGAALANPQMASIIINDDTTEPPTNVIDDANIFVRMHYHDFLNREADQSGLDFWTGQITSCGSDAACTEVRRINGSAAFFLSIEFQQTGYLVERMYKTAYGDATGTSTLGGSHQLVVPVVRFYEFLKDTQRIGQGVVVLAPGWEQLLENNKQAYAQEFVQTPRFLAAFPTTMSDGEFLVKVNSNAGNPLSQQDINQILRLGPTPRALMLRFVAEQDNLVKAEFNRAFVLTQFFGYLRRNPNDLPDTDYTGYEFWLTKLNQFNGDYIAGEMVKAFIASSEYRQRFGP